MKIETDGTNVTIQATGEEGRDLLRKVLGLDGPNQAQDPWTLPIREVARNYPWDMVTLFRNAAARLRNTSILGHAVSPTANAEIFSHLANLLEMAEHATRPASNKIRLIMHLREASGLGLRDAKEVVEDAWVP